MSWERTGLIVGVLLALVTLVAKLKWIGDKIARFAAWVGWRIVWFLIHTESEKSREALRKLQEPEQQAMLERIEKLAEDWHMTRTLIGNLENAVVGFENEVREIRKDLQQERAERRGDVAVWVTRMENGADKIREKVDLVARQTEEGMHHINESLQTVIAAVLGPDDAKRRLRERSAERRKEA